MSALNDRLAADVRLIEWDAKPVTTLMHRFPVWYLRFVCTGERAAALRYEQGHIEPWRWESFTLLTGRASTLREALTTLSKAMDGDVPSVPSSMAAMQDSWSDKLAGEKVCGLFVAAFPVALWVAHDLAGRALWGAL